MSIRDVDPWLTKMQRTLRTRTQRAGKIFGWPEHHHLSEVPRSLIWRGSLSQKALEGQTPLPKNACSKSSPQGGKRPSANGICRLGRPVRACLRAPPGPARAVPKGAPPRSEFEPQTCKVRSYRNLIYCYCNNT